MNKLHINIENCYGIRKLNTILDFSQLKAFAIYAPNGAMKSSLAQTFKDISESKASKDRIYPNRTSIRKITDENGFDISKDSVVVIRPYDDGVIGHSEKTSTLLVDSKLRIEYEALHLDIDKSKEVFIKALKEQSGSKKNLEKEISLTFTKSDDEYFRALIRIKDEVIEQKDAPYASISYDVIFDEKILSLLGTKDVKTAIESYIKKYNELLAESTFFKKGVFNYYNASTIAKNLHDNGFFNAKHSVNLNANEKLEITSQKQLEEIIQKEKDGITKDIDLRKKFEALEKLLYKNITVRDFRAYLEEHEEILPELANIDSFKEKIWKSYFKVHLELFKDLIEKYQAAEQRKREIEDEANQQRTQWEAVIDIFNSRFDVPFKLTAKNRIPVILGQEPMLSLEFTFSDGVDQAPIGKDALMLALSTGEKRAFYILNIIFEVEVRKESEQETIFVIDDIADSFDYKNKYAIIQYLKDISEEPYFRQIILTHNFDFFRTINYRFVDYSHCLMGIKRSDGISLEKATGIRNVFVNDWKPNFFIDPKKKIASVPFMRNIIEYTRGDQDPDYLKLTSLLHWKNDTKDITENDLETIYNSIFCTSGSGSNGSNLMIDLIKNEARECLNADGGINFENKIVLSIAIRITTEEFMISEISDSTAVNNITSNQTSKLLKKYKSLYPDHTAAIKIIQEVLLMTPENIHLNSFMYEPILDMSDEHLKKLYNDVLSLL